MKKRHRPGYRFPNRCFVRVDGTLRRMDKAEAHALRDQGRRVEFVPRHAAKAGRKA